MKKKGLAFRLSLTLPVVGILLLGVPLVATTQSVTSLTQDSPLQSGLPLTLSMNVMAMSNPSSTHEELPGLGHKFELIGVMVRDTDPENAVGNSGNSGGGSNETISATMTPTTFALAYRNLPPGIKSPRSTTSLGLNTTLSLRAHAGAAHHA